MRPHPQGDNTAGRRGGLLILGRSSRRDRGFHREDFDGFYRPGIPSVYFVCFTQYDLTFCLVAFPPQNLQNTLGEVLSDQGLKQLRIAETEKYAHVTFF